MALDPRSPHAVTQLLGELRSGNQSVLHELVPLLYQELHRLAAHHLSQERKDHTLQATALVNEAYLRLAGQSDVSWQNRAHFLGVASRLMRQILVDYARSHAAAKRGGGQAKLSLEALDVAQASSSDEQLAGILDLEEALERLIAMDPDQGRIVELRFYGGLTVEEVAEVLGISPATVKREWTLARAWLHRELSEKHKRQSE